MGCPAPTFAPTYPVLGRNRVSGIGRNRCSICPGIAVRFASEWVFGLARNGRSFSVGISVRFAPEYTFTYDYVLFYIPSVQKQRPSLT